MGSFKQIFALKQIVQALSASHIKVAQTQYLPLELSNFNFIKLICIVLLILRGVIEINFCSKTLSLGVKSHFIMKNLRNKIGAQYLP